MLGVDIIIGGGGHRGGIKPECSVSEGNIFELFNWIFNYN